MDDDEGISIPADSTGTSDIDSAYDEEPMSITATLTSSIWDYKYENGRRYNAFRPGEYW